MPSGSNSKRRLQGDETLHGASLKLLVPWATARAGEVEGSATLTRTGAVRAEPTNAPLGWIVDRTFGM
jgi:hypothetical protein